MNYSIYPIHDSDFHQINKKINLSPNSKCIETQGYNYNDKCILQVNNGYHKPLNELCMEKHYKIIDRDPKDICSSPWNNLTKRKSLVKYF